MLQHCVQQQQSVLCTGAPGPTGQMETTPQQHGSSTTPRRPCKPTKTNPPGYPTRTTATHLQEDVRRQQQGGHVYCIVLAVQLKSAPYRPQLVKGVRCRQRQLQLLCACARPRPVPLCVANGVNGRVER